MMRIKLYALALGAALSSSLACQSQPRKPNIIFIYTDDQAYWTLGASGNKQAHTPNLDRLAREGAFFENAFVTTPVCSPARAALLTSQYASESGIYDFIAQPGHVLYDPLHPVGLPDSSVTFAEVLASDGYTTGLVGKWHLGDWTQTDDKQYHPTNHGFHYFMGLTGGGTSPVDPELEEDGQVRPFKGLTTDILTGYAMDFIKSNKERPFLLWLSYRAPHGKWLPVAEEDWAPYEHMDPEIPNSGYPDLDVEKVKKMMREYLASVSGVDRNVGRLLGLIRELGLEEETIVIFSSDHGYNMGHNGIWHKGNGIWATRSLPPATKNIASKYRPNLYDQSLHVPAIVRWPGVVRPGTVISQTVSSLDWYPTILEMAGARQPDNKTIRGRSLLPLLRGRKVKGWNNDLFAEYSMIHYSRAFMRAYRTPEWKLVRDFLNPWRDELYHLKTDPAERHNLINSTSSRAQSVVRELDRKIKEYMEKVHDPLLKDTSAVFPENSGK